VIGDARASAHWRPNAARRVLNYDLARSEAKFVSLLREAVARAD